MEEFKEVFRAEGLRVTENDIEAPYDGGRVVLTANVTLGTDLFEEQKLSGVTCMLNYRLDKAMAQWPATRAEKEKYEYEIVINRRAVK